jgi:hypothetical protein
MVLIRMSITFRRLELASEPANYPQTTAHPSLHLEAVASNRWSPRFRPHPLVAGSRIDHVIYVEDVFGINATEAEFVGLRDDWEIEDIAS